MNIHDAQTYFGYQLNLAIITLERLNRLILPVPLPPEILHREETSMDHY